MNLRVSVSVSPTAAGRVEIGQAHTGKGSGGGRNRGHSIYGQYAATRPGRVSGLSGPFTVCSA